MDTFRHMEGEEVRKGGLDCYGSTEVAMFCSIC